MGTTSRETPLNRLASSAGVPLLPLFLQPSRDGHRAISLPAVRPQAASHAYQTLLDSAMASDPAPWSRWCCVADHF